MATVAALPTPSCPPPASPVSDAPTTAWTLQQHRVHGTHWGLPTPAPLPPEGLRLVLLAAAVRLLPLLVVRRWGWIGWGYGWAGAVAVGVSSRRCVGVSTSTSGASGHEHTSLPTCLMPATAAGGLAVVPGSGLAVTLVRQWWLQEDPGLKWALGGRPRHSGGIGVKMRVDPCWQLHDRAVK